MAGPLIFGLLSAERVVGTVLGGLVGYGVYEFGKLFWDHRWGSVFNLGLIICTVYTPTAWIWLAVQLTAGLLLMQRIAEGR